MKTIAYSEVPENPQPYVHLAYLSANSEPAGIAFATTIMIAVTYLLAYLVGAIAKLDVKFPKFWRLTTLAVVTVTGCLLLFGLVFGQPLAGR
jgi:hypothetical protein